MARARGGERGTGRGWRAGEEQRDGKNEFRSLFSVVVQQFLVIPTS